MFLTFFKLFCKKRRGNYAKTKTKIAKILEENFAFIASE
jgi:hypothetical protein